MSFSTQLAAETRKLIAEARGGHYASPELVCCGPLLRLQARWSALPGEREWLIERIATRDGHYLFFYPFEGRLVHLGLATLFSYRLSRAVARSFTITCNDYGFALLSHEPVPLSLAELGRLLAAPDVERDMLSGLNASELARRQFREIARAAVVAPSRLSGPGQDRAPAAGVERPHLRCIRRIRPGKSVALASGARGSRAPAGSLASAGRARAHARRTRAVHAAAAADAVRLSAYGRGIPRPAVDRGTRGARRAHGRGAGSASRNVGAFRRRTDVP